MRIFLHWVAALAVAAGLTACSPGGVPQTFFGASQAAAPAIHAPAPLIVSDVKRDANCPHHDNLGCVIVNYDNGASIQLCGHDYSHPTCFTSPVYTWSSAITTNKGIPTSKFAASFNPNPAYLTTDTITETEKVPSSNGRYRWYQVVTVCTPDGCEPFGSIGIAAQ